MSLKNMIIRFVKWRWMKNMIELHIPLSSWIIFSKKLFIFIYILLLRINFFLWLCIYIKYFVVLKLNCKKKLIQKKKKLMFRINFKIYFLKNGFKICVFVYEINSQCLIVFYDKFDLNIYIVSIEQTKHNFTYKHL